MKKLSLLCIAAVSTLLAVHAHAATVGLSPASPTVGLGDIFAIDVVVTDVVDLNTYQYSLAYDSTVLGVVAVDLAGAFLTSAGSLLTIAPTLSAGHIDNASAALLSNAVVSGSGVLSTITFEAIGPGTSPVTFLTAIQADTILVNASFATIPAALQDGSITVLAVPEPVSAVLVLGALALLGLWRHAPTRDE